MLAYSLYVIPTTEINHLPIDHMEMMVDMLITSRLYLGIELTIWNVKLK